MKRRPAPLTVLLTALVVLVAAISVAPFLVMIITSLKASSAIFSSHPQWLPSPVRWDNYLRAFRETPLTDYIENSLIISGGATLLNILAAAPAAYALSRLQFGGKKWILQAVLVTQMFSPVVLVLALYHLISVLNLTDSLWSLILTDGTFSLAFSIWLLTSYFNAIPVEMDEAARLDGCTRIGVFRRVLMPLARPGLAVTALFAFIYAWNEFVFALTFIATPDRNPLTVGLFDFVGRYEVQWNLLMAASVIAVVPVILIFMFIERHLVEGLTAGAVR